MDTHSPVIEAKLQLVSNNVVAFGTFLSAYKECSEEVRTIVDQMYEIIVDDDSTKEEKEHAIDVVAESLFPGLMQDVREAHAFVMSREHDSDDGQRLDEQEASFAQRLRELMTTEGLTQTELAKRAGVQQPAISMMLARTCRPQQRTVLRLADALHVQPDDLWPQQGKDD